MNIALINLHQIIACKLLCPQSWKVAYVKRTNRWEFSHINGPCVLRSTGDKSNKISMQRSCPLEVYNFLANDFRFQDETNTTMPVAACRQEHECV